MTEDDVEPESSATDSTVDAPSMGTTVGRYLVIEEVGSGGMGRVMRGYDPRLHREVALKQLHAGLLPGAAQAQLLAEARTMAKLSHPNIVAIYDVFSERDTAILVMAFVRGQTLAEWLVTRRTPEQIVRMFSNAARGLMAAHRRGILHRDFKPTNVLVNAAGEPKVTDFGLARVPHWGVGSSAANVDADDITTLREFPEDSSGARMGTPAYMAPEQHMDGPLDERTDQYAFCIALWEALTGHLPFAGGGDRERLAQAKFDGPPRWPSSIKVDPAIVAALRRGLSPHPYDRWPSMEALCGALAAGLRRRPPRRQMWWWLAPAAAAGLGGAAWASWPTSNPCGAGEERIARSWNEHEAATIRDSLRATDVVYAEAVWDRLEPALQSYATRWASLHDDACRTSGVLTEQAASTDLEFRCLSDALASFEATLDRLRDADARTAERALDLVSRLPPLDRCGDEPGLGDVVLARTASPGLLERFHRELAEARTLWFVGRYDHAAAVLADLRVAIGDVGPSTLAVEVGLLEGHVFTRQGRYVEAEAELRRTYDLALQIGHWRGALMAAQMLIKSVGYDQHRFDEGLAWGRIAAGLQDRVGTSWALAASDTANNLGLVFFEAGDPERAELEHRRALEQRVAQLGSDHIRVADSHNNIAMALYKQGRYAEAEAEHRLALALRAQALGPDHPDVAASHNNLGMTLRARQALPEAEREYLLAEEIWTRSLGPEHPHLVLIKNNLGNLYSQQERPYEAERVLRNATELAKRAHGPRSTEFARALSGLAVTLHDQRRYEEAEAAFREVLELYIEIVGPGHHDVAGVHQNLGNLLIDQQRYDAAEIELERALAVFEASLGPEHPDTAFPLCGLAELAVARGRPRDALPFVLRCHAIRVEHDAPPPLLNAAVSISVDVFVALGQVGRAKALVQSTLALLEPLGPAAEVERQGLQDWLEDQP